MAAYTPEEDNLWETVQEIHSENGTPNHRDEGPSAISYAIEGLDILGPISLGRREEQQVRG